MYLHKRKMPPLKLKAKAAAYISNSHSELLKKRVCWSGFVDEFPPPPESSLPSPALDFCSPPTEYLPPPFMSVPHFVQPSQSEKRKFQVYGFGKTVWELYTGKKPVDEDDLADAPFWVKEIVDKC